MQQEWQCRWSPTLGELEDTHQKVWGTLDYKRNDLPTVFFGLYGLPDFYALWRHKGERHILWAGSDIRHFVNGYWLDGVGKIKLDPKTLAEWINKYCKSWTENVAEHDLLAIYGIESEIVPSFLGDVNQFEVSFKPGNKLYTSVSGNEFLLYGWDKIPKLALGHPDVEFHLYGSTRPYQGFEDGAYGNVISHGRIPKEQMNAEIREMQGALRLTEFDGFSEILAKSILMGQYPVSLIPYPYMLTPHEIDQVLIKTKPNRGRDFYLKTLNRYPWNKN